MILPQDYITQKFYQYAGSPRYKKLSGVYEASCPICREGKSWGRKKRCYYLIKENSICCHNCGWFGTPVNWIMQVSGMSYEEVCNESKNYDILPVDIIEAERQDKEIAIPAQSTLPLDSINLFDQTQVNYYKDNNVVQDALALIERRKLSTAINKPDTLWLSLSDFVHKNRIIIPFYNTNNDIIFYQSRAIYDKDARYNPKYLGKINSSRSLFNINKISPALDYIFIFEGPIDAFFVANGVAIAGIQEKSDNTFTGVQEEQISSLRMYKKIWVLDSQWLDTSSRNKTERLLNINESVFIWPEELGKKYKDINDVCIAANRDYIEPSLFIKNSYTGLKGKLMLSKIV